MTVTVALMASASALSWLIPEVYGRHCCRGFFTASLASAVAVPAMAYVTAALASAVVVAAMAYQVAIC